MKIKCPFCNQAYEIEQAMIGEEVQCQSCGQSFFADEDMVYDKEILPPKTETIVSSPVPSKKNTEQTPVVNNSFVQETKTTLKPLTCDMCGSTNIMKQDGVFVCQSCGTKYSVEEAKKMMASGTINVAGTVQIDNSSFVVKYLENARRAYEKDDWEEVEKYYNLVERESPKCIEAVFFSSFGKAMLSLTDEEYFKRQQKFDVLKKSISVINDYYEETTEDKEAVLRKICNAVERMLAAQFVYSPDKSSIMDAVGSKSWSVSLLSSVKDAVIIELKQIQEIHKDVQYLQELINHLSNLQLSNSGCYIATAVYGSYDCPQVWTLRRYRDNNLAATFLGRAFIRSYYAISPTLVRWFGNTEWFKSFWKKRLDQMVNKLKADGVEGTPYHDRKW